MAETGRLTQSTTGAPERSSPAFSLNPVLILRIVILTVVLGGWEALSASGLLFKDVVPSLLKIGEAMFVLLSTPAFYHNLGVTGSEVGAALAIGGFAGVVAGLLLGFSPFMSRAYEHISIISRRRRRSSSFP